MTNHETIKALRDALTDITEPIAAMRRDLPEGYSLDGAAAVQMANDPEHYKRIARQALALTADASEDAPDSVLMDRQYLAGYDAGFMAGERGDGEARTRVHAFRDREISAALAARPAPVAATLAPADQRDAALLNRGYQDGIKAALFKCEDVIDDLVQQKETAQECGALRVKAELQDLASAPFDPMDWPLPCDVKIGSGTIRKGCKLRTLVRRATGLHRMLMEATPQPTPEQRAAFEALIGGAAAPAASVVAGSVLTVGQILAADRRSNMSDDEALRFGRAIESMTLRAAGQAAPIAEVTAEKHDFQRCADLITKTRWVECCKCGARPNSYEGRAQCRQPATEHAKPDLLSRTKTAVSAILNEHAAAMKSGPDEAARVLDRACSAPHARPELVAHAKLAEGSEYACRLSDDELSDYEFVRAYIESHNESYALLIGELNRLRDQQAGAVDGLADVKIDEKGPK